MIALFTDYGINGPYVGQVHAVLSRIAPDEKIVNLMLDLPRQNQKAAAYMLARCVKEFNNGTIFFCVVDPGVGTFVDDPVVLKLDESWYVGPNNGLFNIVARNAEHIECWKIHWRPEELSNSFHGRDLYAPICAMIANGLDIPGEKITWQDNPAWPDDLQEIIYIDGFGNCITGFRATDNMVEKTIYIHKHVILHATTFSEVKLGEVFWYENSLGLVEIAVNQGSARNSLGINIGDEFAFR
ncbi:MAG TPA: SAM-dependent chlorinase/fluorinase [Gammaproteobacteria bacterium]|nr:SAM-dependent chlorinase/fluorinase [Gammaproteobacteria bacterium]